MIIYPFFLILSLLPLFEGEPLGIGRLAFLIFCLPLSFYLYRRHKNSFGLPLFLAFLFFALLATVFSPVFSRSFSTLILYFAYLIYFLAAQNLALENRRLFKNLLGFGILLPSLVITFLSFYLLFLRATPPLSAMNLVFANFGHNHLVDFLIFSFPVSLILFLEEKKSKKKLLFFLVNLVLLAGFIFSFSRGGLLMALLEILLFVTWNRKKGKLFYPLLLAGVFLLVLSLMIGGYVYLKNNDFNFSRSFIWQKAFRQPSLASRLDYCRQAILAFKEKPLFGWGLNHFRYLSVKYQKSPGGWSYYAHNHFLQLLAETGIFGGMLFLLLVGRIVKKVLSLKSAGLELGLKIGLVGSVVHSFMDYDWQFTSVFLLFWVIAGYLIAPQSVRFSKKKAFLLLGGLIFLVGVLEFTGNLLVVSGDEKGLAIWPLKLENWTKVINEKKSLSLAGRLIVLEPINPDNYEKLADLAVEQSLTEIAFANYQKALKLNPQKDNPFYKIVDLWPKIESKDWPWLFSFLSDLEKTKGKYCLLKCLGFENEEKILNLLLQLEKSPQFGQFNKVKQAKVYYWLAVLTTYQKNWDQDIVYLRKAVELDSKSEYQSFLNDLLALQDLQTSFAKTDFVTAKKLALGFVRKEKDHLFYEKFYLDEVYSILGRISYQEGDLAQTAAYWQTAIDINQWGGQSYLDLAEIYQEKGEIGRARQVLIKCLELDWWKDSCRKELNKLPPEVPHN